MIVELNDDLRERYSRASNAVLGIGIASAEIDKLLYNHNHKTKNVK